MSNTVTLEQVESSIVEKEVRTVSIVGKLHTMVAVRLVNDFTIIETTTCVDPDNYSEEIGSSICMDKIMSKIWMLEGYNLSSKLKEGK